MPLGAGFLSWVLACRTIEKKTKIKPKIEENIEKQEKIRIARNLQKCQFLAPETDPFWRFLAPEITKKDQFLDPEIAKKVWRTYIQN